MSHPIVPAKYFSTSLFGKKKKAEVNHLMRIKSLE